MTQRCPSEPATPSHIEILATPLVYTQLSRIFSLVLSSGLCYKYATIHSTVIV